MKVWRAVNVLDLGHRCKPRQLGVRFSDEIHLMLKAGSVLGPGDKRERTQCPGARRAGKPTGRGCRGDRSPAVRAPVLEHAPESTLRKAARC